MAICRVSADTAWLSLDGIVPTADPIWYESEPCLFLWRTTVFDPPVYIVSSSDGSITVVYCSAPKVPPSRSSHHCTDLFGLTRLRASPLFLRLYWAFSATMFGWHVTNIV